MWIGGLPTTGLWTLTLNLDGAAVAAAPVQVCTFCSCMCGHHTSHCTARAPDSIQMLAEQVEQARPWRGLVRTRLDLLPLYVCCMLLCSGSTQLPVLLEPPDSGCRRTGHSSLRTLALLHTDGAAVYQCVLSVILLCVRACALLAEEHVLFKSLVRASSTLLGQPCGRRCSIVQHRPKVCNRNNL